MLFYVGLHHPYDARLFDRCMKATALESPVVCECLYSADSMAWSFAARYEGRDGNSPNEARRFVSKIDRAVKHHEDCIPLAGFSNAESR